MARLTIRVPAEPTERYAKDAADGLPGQPFAASHGDQPLGQGTVVEAWVEEDGTALVLDVEWPG